MKNPLKDLVSFLAKLGKKNLNGPQNTWKPFTEAELNQEISNGKAGMSPEEQELWNKIRITPQKWKQTP